MFFLFVYNNYHLPFHVDVSCRCHQYMNGKNLFKMRVDVPVKSWKRFWGKDFDIGVAFYLVSNDTVNEI